jgi:ribonuclease HI
MHIEVYTDGSRIGKGKLCKCGYGIYFPNKELSNVSKPFIHPPLTHQRAELYAIYKALKLITRNLNFNKITVYTDSEYSIKSVTIWINTWKKNGWKTAQGKPVYNIDIITKIDHYIQKYPNKIFFEHVRAHTNKKDYKSIGNDFADKLAKAGCNL